MKDGKTKNGKSGYEKIAQRDNSRSISLIILVENSQEILLPKESGDTKSEREGACKFHIHNQRKLLVI
jgi:hypothetical protein